MNTEAESLIEQPSESTLTGYQAILMMAKMGTMLALQDGLRLENIEPKAVNVQTDPVYGHWMSVILVMTPAFHATLKFFSSSPPLRIALARTLRRGLDEVPLALVHDFMRELSNTSAGHLKRSLEHNGHESGVSLPLVSRGFDNLFLEPTQNRESFSDKWAFEYDTDGLMVCTLEVGVLDMRALLKVEWTPEQTRQEAGGEMEFL